MPKIKTLKPLVSTMKPRLGYTIGNERERSQCRDRTQAWRAWYKTSKWQKLRWSVLTRDLFTCQMCGKMEANTSQLVSDHIKPHRGNEALFWDRDNLQCLCTNCHNSAKQKEEQGSLHMRGVWD